MERADRFNTGKRQWSLVDFKSLEPLVKVLEYGAVKYSPHNYKKGLPITETCESLLRHTMAFLEGEDIDPESGLEHVGHIMANAMFLAYNMREKKEIYDNRFKNGKTEETRPAEGDFTGVRRTSETTLSSDCRSCTSEVKANS